MQPAIFEPALQKESRLETEINFHHAQLEQSKEDLMKDIKMKAKQGAHGWHPMQVNNYRLFFV